MRWVCTPGWEDGRRWALVDESGRELGRVLRYPWTERIEARSDRWFAKYDTYREAAIAVQSFVAGSGAR